MEKLLQIRNLKKYFPVDKGLWAQLFPKKDRFVRTVDDISFFIREGEVLGLAGESGCGKTTTGRLVLRLLEPTSGEVVYRGTSIFERSEKEMVIARALISGPDFVVADEPLAMADVSVRAMILELMVQLKKELDLTYLFITHDLATCKYICDRIAIMYLGQILEIGPLKAVFTNPAHPYTQSLLSAVPVPDPKFRRTHPIPKGEIPSAIRPPPGCRFHPRCSRAEAGCAMEPPQLLQVEGDHWAACRKSGSREDGRPSFGVRKSYLRLSAPAPPQAKS